MSYGLLRLYWLYAFAIIDFLTGAYIFSIAKSAVHEIEAILFVGFGTLTFGLAAILHAVSFPGMRHLLDFSDDRARQVDRRSPSTEHSALNYKGVEYVNTEGFAVRTVGLSQDRDFDSVGDLRLWVDRNY